MKKNGFTLVELLTVILILGALVVFVIGANLAIMRGSREKIEEIAMKQLNDGGKLFLADIDQGLYGYYFPLDDQIGSFTYPGTTKHRIMLDNANDEAKAVDWVNYTSDDHTVNNSNAAAVLNKNWDLEDPTGRYTTDSRLEIDTYGGQQETQCDSGSIINIKRKSRTDNTITDIFILCKYVQTDDVLTEQIESESNQQKIIRLSECQKTANPNQATIIGGQMAQTYCTKLTDSYFGKIEVQYLPGYMIYGYEARAYMAGTYNGVYNRFRISASFLAERGYYVDGKCNYDKIDLEHPDDPETVKERKKCRVDPTTLLDLRIKTRTNEKGTTYLSDGYEVELTNLESEQSGV